MVNQYRDYGSIPSDVQSLISNKIALFDRYILLQTGQYEYTALVLNPATDKCTEYVISRSGSYNSEYTVSSSLSDFEYNVSNEYYVYSNVGLGKSLDLPVIDGVISYSLMFIAVLLSFAVVFKGALFRCLRRR